MSVIHLLLLRLFGTASLLVIPLDYLYLIVEMCQLADLPVALPPGDNPIAVNKYYYYYYYNMFRPLF